MEVILKEKVEKLGNLGDIVTVKNGYARNYLLPFGKAIQNNKKNLDEFKKHKLQLEKEELLRINNYKKEAETLTTSTLIIEANAGSNGKLFGSIGTKEISDIIYKKHSIKIERRNIKIKRPIRSLGEHDIHISLYNDITVNIQILIKQNTNS